MLSLCVCFLQDQMALCKESGLQVFIDTLQADIASASQAKDVLKAGVARLFLAGALNTLDCNIFGAEVRRSRLQKLLSAHQATVLSCGTRQPSHGCDQRISLRLAVLAKAFDHRRACGRQMLLLGDTPSQNQAQLRLPAKATGMIVSLESHSPRILEEDPISLCQPCGA